MAKWKIGQYARSVYRDADFYLYDTETEKSLCESPVRHTLETIVGMQDALALCVKALKKVEWIYSDDGDWVYCHWCKQEWYSNQQPEDWKHAPDCLRQRALAAVDVDTRRE